MTKDERCELLEKLGFEIGHEDSSVYMVGIEFDFSATAAEPWAIIQTAILKAQELGQEEGRRNLQDNMKTLLGLNT